mmetsp:Transcript_32058/g.96049  ORF Transcript_32058/g.96049 Transcript_32058/m.96049 type:complete len:764 (-) Transcript_32058:944-3235(-)
METADERKDKVALLEEKQAPEEGKDSSQQSCKVTVKEEVAGEETEEEDDSQQEDGMVLSEYELLRLERIKRNRARLLQLGLLDGNNLVGKPVIHTPKKRKRREILEPVRHQPKRQTTTRQKESEASLDHIDWNKSSKSEAKRTGLSRCGNCEGCLMEEDCNTCIHCAERLRIGGRRRCIFKQCRVQHHASSHNEEKQRHPTTRTTRQQQQAKENDTVAKLKCHETSSTPSACDVCRQSSQYLISCTNCNRGYHSNCHVPKIKNLPFGGDEWLCMDCHPKSAKYQLQHLGEDFVLGKGSLWATLPSSSSAAASSSPVPNRLVKCKVLPPSPLCAVCQMICLSAPATASFLPSNQKPIQCKACDEYYHLECHGGLKERPRGRGLAYWKCSNCVKANRELLPHHRQQLPKRVKKKAKKQPSLLSRLKLFDGEHDDDCFICCSGGDLVCCDFCEKVFHMACHIPALPALPTGIWKCCECYAAERHNQKMTRCGDCPACMSEDCGQCKACKDNTIKFGGRRQGTTRQECKKKPKCPHLSYAETYVPGKIPGEVFTQEEIDEMKNSEKGRGKRKSETTTNEIRYFDPDEPTDDDEVGPIIVKLSIPKLTDPESTKIRKVINSARRVPMDSKVQDKACAQIRKLATSSSSCDKIVLAGGVEMISNAMTHHPDKAVLQAEAFAAIAQLAWINPQVAIKLAHVGVVQKIIHSMEEFPTNAKVQEMGCGAFRALSYEGSNIVVINNAYGITATLNSIKRNPRKLAVQKEAAGK